MADRYEVLRPLERGPDVRVYLVSDHWEADRHKILTLLPFDTSKEEDRLEVERLYTLRRALDHPLLIQIEDLAFRGRQIGVITPFISERPIKDYLNVPVEKRYALALQLADLFLYLHGRDFFCGYVTPWQLFVKPDAQLLANILTPRTQIGAKSPNSHAMRYTSPEFLQSGTVNAKSDLYSLGMIFYYLFTGYEPYAEDEDNTVKQKQLLSEPSRPRKLDPDIPPRVEELILELIQKRSELRPLSASYAQKVLLDCKPIGRLEAVPRFRSGLVGREKELAAFRECVERYVKEPRTSFVAISGPSGIGKTALMSSFEIIARIRGIKTYSASHHLGSGATEAFCELFRQLTRGVDGLPQASENGQREDYDQDVAGTFPSALQKITSRQLVMFCVNDLQWMDEGSLEIYKALIRAADSPVLVVGNYRTDELPGHSEGLKSELIRKQILTEFILEPLRNGEVTTLLSTLLGQAPPQELTLRITSRCSGNPFYIYEFMRSSQEKGELIFESGLWRWAPLVNEDTDIPRTISDYINTRLRALPGKDRELLQYLAIAERPIPLHLLARMLRRTREEMTASLRLLERLDLAIGTGTLRYTVASLCHDWISRSLQDRLDTQTRRLIHRRIASVLEREYQKKRDCFLLKSLVHHFGEAGARSKVMEYIGPAVEWLEQARLYKDAARLFERAVDIRPVSLANSESTRKAIDLFYLSGQLEKCLAIANEFLKSPAVKPDDQCRPSVLMLVASLYSTQGRPTEAVASVEAALSVLERQPQDQESITEAQAHILFYLALSGRFSRVKKLMAQLSQKLPEIECLTSIEKLYHAFAFANYALGHPMKSQNWQAKSISAAIHRKKYIRAAGRMVNLATCYTDQGEFEIGQSLIRYVLDFASETGNSEVAVFGRIIRSQISREQGQHQDSIQGLAELAAMNQQSNHNGHIQAEAHINLARNLNHQLLPAQALAWIRKSREFPATKEVFCSWVDAILAEGWSWIWLGQPRRALNVTSKLHWRKIFRERGWYFILRGYAYFFLEDLDRAWRNARRALESIPAYMLYDRTRAELLMAEVILAQGRLQRSVAHLEGGLRIAKEKFYFPLMVQAYVLKGKWLSASGNYPVARVYCLRALQIAKHVERAQPRAEAYCTLGNIEMILGQRDKALQHLTEALQIYKERLLHLSPDYRDDFTRQFIAPIDKHRNELLSDAPHASPRYLIRLRHFMATVREVQNQKELGDRILKTIASSIPGVSANLFVRQLPGSAFELAASLGRCRQSGRQLLSLISSDDNLFSASLGDGPGPWDAALGIPLRVRGELMGLLYLEHNGHPISESDIDFLSCIASVAETQLKDSLAVEGDRLTGFRATVLRDVRIVGEHPSMKRLLAEVERVAITNATVLITGESGTGKELIARAIHEHSRRKEKKLVPINCAALPAELIENELFGHVRGSFTGAQTDEKGFFEVASGGTLFLDEIGSMALSLQSRLLRVLQEQKIRRIGEGTERPVDVRIIAATNQPLAELVRQHQFREDLYHRLNVCQLHVPPLRERSSDIVLLMSHFLAGLHRRQGQKKQISPEAVEVLKSYSFPGNVRELKNIIESAYYLSPGKTITESDMVSRLQGRPTSQIPTSSHAGAIIDDIVAGRTDFWTAVRQAYLQHDLSRSDVREIISIGLTACGGRYRELLEHFRMRPDEYKKLISFLSSQNCKVDFRPFRQASG